MSGRKRGRGSHSSRVVVSESVGVKLVIGIATVKVGGKALVMSPVGREVFLAHRHSQRICEIDVEGEKLRGCFVAGLDGLVFDYNVVSKSLQ